MFDSKSAGESKWRSQSEMGHCITAHYTNDRWWLPSELRVTSEACCSRVIEAVPELSFPVANAN